jgi:glucokinase
MEILGADLGGTNFRVGLVRGNALEHISSVAINAAGTEQEVFDQLCGLVDREMSAKVAGIGVGVPSVADLATGVVYDVQNIPSWKEIKLKERLEQRYRVPVRVNNDANCFAAGENYFGKARPYDFAVGLIMGTGLGAGIIANGKLYSGVNCGAGEFGMIPYRDGIFEHYCCGQFFKRKYGVSGAEACALAGEQDAKALAMFAEFGGHVGEAVKMIMYAVDPEMIVLGGSVSKSFRFFEKAMRETLRSYTYPHALGRLRLEVSDTENIAILGAAALYLDAIKTRKPPAFRNK